ncbi:hypothetical protein TNCV_4747691 [Trichonephila clavipes]|nr:hypothetical protein TNCV_4747691 [Trichonephila clavipes]
MAKTETFVYTSKNIIDGDSKVDEGKKINAAPVPTSSEMRNIMEKNYHLFLLDRTADHVIITSRQSVYWKKDIPGLLQEPEDVSEDCSSPFPLYQVSDV